MLVTNSLVQEATTFFWLGEVGATVMLFLFICKRKKVVMVFGCGQQENIATGVFLGLRK
jgi:hypothetical protein